MSSKTSFITPGRIVQAQPAPALHGNTERSKDRERAEGKWQGEANGYRALDGEEGGGREDDDKSRTAESS